MLQALKNLLGFRDNSSTLGVRLQADGFTVHRGSEVLFTVLWAEVREVFAFRDDLCAKGRIFLGFRTSDGVDYFRVDEDMAGFDQLAAEVERVFPNREMDWRTKVKQFSSGYLYQCVWRRQAELPAERRVFHRRPARASARVTCRKGDGPNLAARLLDVSEGGTRLLVRAPLSPGDDVLLELEGPEPHTGRVVWSADLCVGVRLKQSLDSRALQLLAD